MMRNLLHPKTMKPSETLGSPHTSQKTRSNRKSKLDSENVHPNVPAEMCSPSPFSATKSSAAKAKSPLPPRPPTSNPNPLKRKLNLDTVHENSVSAAQDSGVKVVVRIRPPSKDEEEGSQIVQKISPDSLSFMDQAFTFDSVANTNASQKEIFELVGIPLVENCLSGFNSSIFAYGQTGSGKTYTMLGPPSALTEDNVETEQQGLTPRVFELLFARIEEEQMKHADKKLKYQCRCSFLEIYNEQISDLLDPYQKNLQIREDVKSGVYVDNLTEEYVSTMLDVRKLLIKGISNRKTGATCINAESSRSHSVFTCVVESHCKSVADGLSSVRSSRINLVDLAGSERQKLTGAAGERLKEAGNINRSLLQLGNLINILAEVSQTGKQRHIPYRDSRLTFLLQESLGGNAKLIMICAISPAQSCKNETQSTLRFAQRAKVIKNKAVVNETTQDDVNVLREQIRLLKDELLRMKSSGNSEGKEGYLTGWNARRSLNLLKLSLKRPMTLHHNDDSDEEMEIDEEYIDKLSLQVGVQSTTSEVQTDNPQNIHLNESLQNRTSCEKISEGDIDMKDCEQDVKTLDHLDNQESSIPNDDNHVAEKADLPLSVIKSSCNTLTSKNLTSKSSVYNSTAVEAKDSEANVSFLGSILPDQKICHITEDNNSDRSIVTCNLSPILHYPALSSSPKATSECGRSCRSSLSFTEPLENNNSIVSTMPPTEKLAASLQHGLQVIDRNRKSLSLRYSSFRFSIKPIDISPLPVHNKVDVGVQTLPLDLNEVSDMEYDKTEDRRELQIIPVDGHVSDKTQQQLPKVVEKVLAGAIRREMALEEICSKQSSEISLLNRLVQQYKHERECNAIIGQLREDKICRLEGLMDGVLPKDEFLDEDFFSLKSEHRLLKEKFENHPEVLRTKIDFKRIQDELVTYQNFFDMGEREVLMEEIQHLRTQLQYYLDLSNVPLRRPTTNLLNLTYSDEPPECSLSTIPESSEESADEKFEFERKQWAEKEIQLVSLTEKIRHELEASRSLAKKREQELESEKKCSLELREALQTAMEGHTRILEQFAELEEKHIALLSRHRKIRDGIEDVKGAAAKAGFKGAGLKFIDSIASGISAFKVEREKEISYLREMNRGLQAQLSDTVEAVQAASELLVRLKEAEEAAAISQNEARIAQKKAEEAQLEISELKRKYEKEIVTHPFLSDSVLPREPIRPQTFNDDVVKYDEGEMTNLQDQSWREEFEPFNNGGDCELLNIAEPSWFSGYDRCNI